MGPAPWLPWGGGLCFKGQGFAQMPMTIMFGTGANKGVWGPRPPSTYCSTRFEVVRVLNPKS